MIFLKNSFFIFLLLFFFVLGYGTFDVWWQFILSFFLISILVVVFFGKASKELLGLNFSVKEVLFAAGVCVFFFFLAHFAIRYSLPDVYELRSSYNIWDFINNLFQSLNEEVVFRALLTSFFLYLGFARWKIVFVPAVLFSLAHWLMFRFNLNPANRGELSLTTMLTLFFFSSSMTMIFLKTRNVLIPWAFHAAWNFNRFSLGIIKRGASEERILEYLGFNLLEGSPLVFSLSFLLFLVSFKYTYEKVYLYSGL